MATSAPMLDIAPAPLALPKSIRKRARGLLDQQLWNFGCDARNSAGNLLLDFGFHRNRPATFGLGSTAYSLNIADPETYLVVWGFGAFAGYRHEGVFLRRFNFKPMLASIREPVIHVHLPKNIRARSLTTGTFCKTRRQQLGELLQTFARYEQWVSGTHGAGYRESCLRERTPRARRESVPPTQVAEAWREIASHLVGAVVP